MKPELKINNVLRPLGWLYGLITGIRNRMYDTGILKSKAFRIPVISIGNITVGGTGKTPHTEYIASLLMNLYRTAVLSRGYGRHTKGFILSDTHSGCALIGDEPFQIKKRFPSLDVAVCEDRVNGINMLTEQCAPQVIIMDDAFQHRRVSPSLNILLVNYNRNILCDAMLPAGRLRESAQGRKRANIIIITKCPSDLSTDAMDAFASKIAVRPSQKVYFTTLQYGSLSPLFGQIVAPACDSPVLAVTGIADPVPMMKQLHSRYSEVSILSYPDHHEFTKRDIAEMENRLKSLPAGTIIITTAKDAARLSGMDIGRNLKEKIFVLPVKPAFLRDADIFDRTIINHVETFKKL